MNRLRILSCLAIVGCLTLTGCLTQEAKEAKYETYFSEARALDQQNNFEAAIPLYRKAIRALPNDAKTADAYNNLGWALGQVGQYHEAVKAFEAALAINPDYTLARNNLKWVQDKLETAP